jgi:hypothetical protein
MNDIIIQYKKIAIKKLIGGKKDINEVNMILKIK